MAGSWDFCQENFACLQEEILPSAAWSEETARRRCGAVRWQHTDWITAWMRRDGLLWRLLHSAALLS